jgi:hypothetical protein
MSKCCFKQEPYIFIKHAVCYLTTVVTTCWLVHPTNVAFSPNRPHALLSRCGDKCWLSDKIMDCRPSRHVEILPYSNCAFIILELLTGFWVWKVLIRLTTQAASHIHVLMPEMNECSVNVGHYIELTFESLSLTCMCCKKKIDSYRMHSWSGVIAVCHVTAVQICFRKCRRIDCGEAVNVWDVFLLSHYEPKHMLLVTKTSCM